MFWFKKKKDIKQEDFQLPEMPHEHTWKDMPWYMKVYYNGTSKTAGYEIIEPYICVTCGERKNVTLEKEDYSNIGVEERENIFKRVRIRYKKYLKPRAVVEDMINNILLVKDPERLAMLEEMRGIPHKNCGSSAEMKMVKDTEFKINLPEREKK